MNCNWCKWQINKYPCKHCNCPQAKTARFFASGTVTVCKDTSPHDPHVISGYNTIRHGHLVNACPGVKVNWVTGGKVRSGSAETPGTLNGWYSKT